MKTDVIIPFYGRANLVCRCLKALSASSIDGILYLVDDGSPLDDSKLVRQRIDLLPLPIQWIRLRRKSGFVDAVNLAWTQCENDVSVILNSDTVPVPGLLQILATILECCRGIAAVAPTSDNPADLYQYRPITSSGPVNSTYLDTTAISQTPYLTGMCLAVRRNAIDKEYLFDPVFSPGYFEDLDLSCRLRIRGWFLAIFERCRIHHAGQSTFRSESDLDVLFVRNYTVFSKRWGHFPHHRELDTLLRSVRTVRAQGL